MAKKKIQKSPAASKTSTSKTNSKKSAKAKSAAKRGAPFNDQDAKRRLGNFTTAGEHARVGGRTTGIVGQTKKRNKTDQRTKNK
jgi:hypothetical protein